MVSCDWHMYQENEGKEIFFLGGEVVVKLEVIRKGPMLISYYFFDFGTSKLVYK